MKKWLCNSVAVCLVGLLSFVCLPTNLWKTSANAEAESLVDFTVEVETGRDIRVLQLSDTQLIDSAQTRSGRDGVNYEQWDTPNMDEGCYRYILQVVNRYDPDLILMTGDLIYGEFDDNGTSLLRLIDFMDSLETPWAPVFGNHDNESKRGADWQCQQLENAKNCLFKQRDLTGNGNYSVGLKQGGKLVRVFYMLDSNGCSGMSQATLYNGHSMTSVGFGKDQIAWYTESIQNIQADFPDVKYSMAFHIQPSVFSRAMAQYGYDGSDSGVPIDVDNHPDKKEGDFGYLGRKLKSAWDSSDTVWDSIKTLGIDSVFVGHEHCNNASVVYEGVRLAYGLKTGLYDRANYKRTDGSIIGSYSWSASDEPLVGGTAISVGADGAISNSYHVYYDNDNPVTVDEKFTSTLYASFVVNGMTVENIPFRAGDSALSYAPTFPKGYTGTWNEYTLQDKDVTVDSTVTLVTYYATFVADDVEVAQLPFTVEDNRFKKLPKVPEKEGYTGKWESYDLSVGEDIYIYAVYTKIDGEEVVSGENSSDNFLQGLLGGCNSSGFSAFGAILGACFVVAVKRRK